MSEQPAPGRYIYTPAELSDLSYSPLVAPPANFVRIAESDLPGPPAISQTLERQAHAPSRRGRNGPTSGQNSRRQDRRRNTGADIGDFYANSHHSHGHGPGAYGARDHGNRHDRGSRNSGRIEREIAGESVSWLDITPDSSSGFGGFEDGVEEFEKWKESQRSKSSKKKNSALIAKPKTKSEPETVSDPKDNASTSQEPPQQTESEAEELWESAVSLSQLGSSNSRFSTFFKPSEDVSCLPQGSAIGLSQTPQGPISQQRQALSPQNMVPLTSQLLNSQPLTQPFNSQGRAGISSFEGANSPLGMPHGMPGMGNPNMASSMGPTGMGPLAMGPPGMVPPGMTPGMTPGVGATAMAPVMSPPLIGPPGMGFPRTGLQGIPAMVSTYGLTGLQGPGGSQGKSSTGTPTNAPYGLLTSSACSPPGPHPQTPLSSGMAGGPPGLQRVGAPQIQGADDAFFTGLLSRR